MKPGMRPAFKLVLILALLCLPVGGGTALAGGDDMTELKQQIKDMAQQLKKQNELIQEMQKRLQKAEQGQKKLAKSTVKVKKDAKELDKRLSKAELHTATDKVSFGVELVPEAQSIHYNDMLTAPSSLVQGFFTPITAGGFNGGTKAQIQGALGMMKQYGMIPAAEKTDVDNDIIWTTKFRLNMKAKLNESLSFAGRASVYKVWSQGSNIRFYNGRAGDMYLDGNTASLPNGDTIHLERAYFLYRFGPVDLPMQFSLGRRPSTNGPPLEYRDYNLEGGSPLGTIINWQFDGASYNFGLEEKTGIPGAALKLCYGVGFEGGYGNSSSFNNNAMVDDVHMAGLIATFYDDDETSVVMNYAHAWGVTDGFTGLTVMPFIAYREDSNGDGVEEYYFEQNHGGFVSRLEPTTDLGDWDAVSLLYRRKFGFGKVFLSANWSHTTPDKISQNPYYELMGEGLLSSDGNLQSRDGYMLYAGAQFDVPFTKGVLGLEYNYGSKYWFNFTGAEDSLVASKLAARGHVFEGYYIQPIFEKNFFFKVGAQFYDYEYTGSGSQMGEPVDIDQANGLDAVFPIADEVMVFYMNATARF